MYLVVLFVLSIALFCFLSRCHEVDNYSLKLNVTFIFVDYDLLIFSQRKRGCEMINDNRMKWNLF